MSGKIYQGSHLVAQTNDAPLGFEDKGIVLESLAQYEQLEKDGNLQEDVNYYIEDTKLVIRNNQKYGTSINDSASSVSTTYSSAKIEEINTQVWSGTTSEFEALDKTTLKDGQVVNITDDYDEPNTKDVYSLEEVKTNKVWIDGKPVYRKVVNCGALLNNAKKIVAHNISNLETLVFVYCKTYLSSESIWLPIPYVHSTYMVALSADKTNIFLTTYADRTDCIDTYIVIEYTKTTD